MSLLTAIPRTFSAAAGLGAVIHLSRAFVAVLFKEELPSDAERREGAGAWRTARPEGGDCLRTVMFLPSLQHGVQHKAFSCGITNE